MNLEITPGSVVSTGHVLLTGPIQGVVELEDGTVVDVSPGFIEVEDDQADEITRKIGERYAAEGHPDVDEEFVYVAPEDVPQGDVVEGEVVATTTEK